MSNDPFWIKKVLDREHINSARNFPALQQKTDLELTYDNQISERKKISNKKKDFSDKFYEGFYFRGKNFKEAINFTKQQEAPKKSNTKKRKTVNLMKQDNFHEKRAIEFFNIQNTPGPDNYKTQGNIIPKKPESIQGWKAFAPRTHGSKIKLQNFKLDQLNFDSNYEDKTILIKIGKYLLQYRFYI